MAPLGVLLAVVRPAQNFGVREVQLLELVQIVARRGGFELDNRIAGFVREVCEAVVVGRSDRGRRGADGGGCDAGGSATLATGGSAGLLEVGGGGRWRVQATVVDGHRGSVPFGGGRSVRGRGADQVGNVWRGHLGRVRVPRAVQGAALLVAAGARG